MKAQRMEIGSLVPFNHGKLLGLTSLGKNMCNTVFYFKAFVI